MNVGAIAIVLMATRGGNQYAWASPVITGLGVVGLVYWGLLGFVETHATDLILPWTILISRTFIVSTLVGMLAMGDMIGALSYLSTYLQMVYGYSTTTSGLLLAPITVGMLISSILSGVLASRTDRYKIYPVVGPLVVAGAAFWLSRLSTTSPAQQIFAAIFLMGAGIGLSLQLLVIVVQSALPAKYLGTATSGNNFFRRVGVSLGASFIGVTFSSGLTSNFTGRIGTLTRSTDPAVLGKLARFKGAGTFSLAPALVNQSPTALHDTVAGPYTDAPLLIFGWTTPLFVVTSVVALFLPEVPLSQKTAMEQITKAKAEGELNGPTSPQEPDSAPQQAERESTEPAMAADTE